MPDPLERCLAFLGRIDRRCAERAERWRYGTALFHDSPPRVWSLNVLLAEGGVGAEAGELAAAADRVQGAAGLDHRRIAIADDQLGARLAPAFRVLGWKAEALLVMPHAETGKERDPARAAEVARERLEPAWAEGIGRFPYGKDEETVRQLVDQRRVIGEAGNARYFACFVAGRVASYCDLYRKLGFAAAGRIWDFTKEPPVP